MEGRTDSFQKTDDVGGELAAFLRPTVTIHRCFLDDNAASLHIVVKSKETLPTGEKTSVVCVVFSVLAFAAAG